MEPGYIEVYEIYFDDRAQPKISLRKGEVFYSNRMNWSVEVLSSSVGENIELDCRGELFNEGAKVIFMNFGEAVFYPLLLGVEKKYSDRWVLHGCYGKLIIAVNVGRGGEFGDLGVEPRAGLYEVFPDSETPMFVHAGDESLKDIERTELAL